MKLKLSHQTDMPTLALTAETEAECEILQHLTFGICSPNGLKKILSDSDTDFANSLTDMDYQKIRDLFNNVWRNKAIQKKIDIG